MTKGKNKSLIHRKIRQTTKNIDRDIGPHVSHTKMISRGYGAGVSPGDFPKRED